MKSEVVVKRKELCFALRGLDRAGGTRHAVFSFKEGFLTLATSRGKVRLEATGTWEAPVRLKKIREVQKAANALLRLPDNIETVVVCREGTALFLGGHAVSCTTRGVGV